MQNTSIKNWATDEQPREKMLQKGTAALSDTELLAILINNGTKNKSALQLAQELYQKAQNNLTELCRMSVADMCKNIKGIGPAKAITLCAALELGRRRQIAETLTKPSFNTQKNIIDFLQPLLADKTVEEFWVLYLNTKNGYITHEQISTGGITSTIVDIRIILKKAVLCDATNIILAHNHPSGNEQPSQADKQITTRINEACKLMDIKLLDHIIITNQHCFSFSDNDLLY